ncbi:MAG TPA: thioredoxin family protein [Abditibacterium sp.]|jgi:thiol:disulfide interchange protein
MNPDPQPVSSDGLFLSDGTLSEDDIIAQLDAEAQSRNSSSLGSNAPIIALAVFIGAALPALALLTLREHANAFNFSAPVSATTATTLAAAPASYIAWNYTFEAAQQQAAATEKPIMIAFYTDWCPACKWMDKEVYWRPGIVEAAQKFVPLKINADTYPQIAERYKVQKFPTLVWTDSYGNEKSRNDGSLAGPELFAAMQRAY